MKKTLTKLVAMLMVAAMAFSFVGFMPREANAAPVSILENDSPARTRSSEPAAEPDEIVPIIVKLKDAPVLAKTDVSNERSAEMSKALAAKQDKLLRQSTRSSLRAEISKFHITTRFCSTVFRSAESIVSLKRLKSSTALRIVIAQPNMSFPRTQSPTETPQNSALPWAS